MAVWWTKTSSPFSRLRNPKPLASLNHLTVPCSIVCNSFDTDLPRTQCGSLRVGGNRNRQELQIEFYDWIECSTDWQTRFRLLLLIRAGRPHFADLGLALLWHPIGIRASILLTPRCNFPYGSGVPDAGGSPGCQMTSHSSGLGHEVFWQRDQRRPNS